MDLRNECVWFDQVKYEVAEASYQTLLANRHCGLKVEGKAIPHNPISSGIERAMNLIGNSLKSAPINVASTDLEKRVTELEKQNNELKLAMDKILDRLSVLEGRTIRQNGGGKVDDDDDFNLFGSDDEKETPSRNVQKCIGKKKKPLAVAKSSLVLDVKPWDDETDISDMETKVRSVSTDGLVWGASKILPVAYGIKKLQISCVVEDDKVGTDFLEESITAFEDLVQSVDIVAFNKI